MKPRPAGVAFGGAAAGEPVIAGLAAPAIAFASVVTYARAKAEVIGITATSASPRAPSDSSSPRSRARGARGRAGPIAWRRHGTWLGIAVGLIALLSAITIVQRILASADNSTRTQPDPTEEHRPMANERQRQRQERRDADEHVGGRRPPRRRQDPRRDRRRRQLREQPRPGPLLLRERQGRRLRPGADARQPRRLPRPRHRVRRRLRHRQEQGRQGPLRGDLHEAEQHLCLPAGPAHSASRSSAA